jgi:predicted nucleic acid-binding protein
MTFVLDSNVAFKWLVPEDDSDKALRVRDGFRQGIHELIAPMSSRGSHPFSHEGRAAKPGDADSRAHPLQRPAPEPPLSPRHASLPLLPRAYEISSQIRLGVYDCLYVALAEREGCELLTADSKLITNLQPAFPFITSLASMP